MPFPKFELYVCITEGIIKYVCVSEGIIKYIYVSEGLIKYVCVSEGLIKKVFSTQDATGILLREDCPQP